MIYQCQYLIRRLQCSGNWRQRYLLKIKRFCENEGAIVGFTELMHNDNPETKDAFGLAEHSSHQGNLVGAGKLGAFIIQYNSHTFQVGTGFTDTQRRAFWSNRRELLGKHITFKHQKSGAKDKPRFPVFKTIREDI